MRYLIHSSYSDSSDSGVADSVNILGNIIIITIIAIMNIIKNMAAKPTDIFINFLLLDSLEVVGIIITSLIINIL